MGLCAPRVQANASAPYPADRALGVSAGSLQGFRCGTSGDRADPTDVGDAKTTTALLGRITHHGEIIETADLIRRSGNSARRPATPPPARGAAFREYGTAPGLLGHSGSGLDFANATRSDTGCHADGSRRQGTVVAAASARFPTNPTAGRPETSGDAWPTGSGPRPKPADLMGQVIARHWSESKGALEHDVPVCMGLPRRAGPGCIRPSRSGV